MGEAACELELRGFSAKVLGERMRRLEYVSALAQWGRWQGSPIIIV